MPDLTTQFLGLTLPHPFISGACPLADTLDGVRRLEDGGAAAIVLRSLFEEQLTAEGVAAFRSTDAHTESHGEALSYLPPATEYKIGPEEYLDHLCNARAAVNIPVIASLNGVTLGRWLEYARLIEQAGASALELNVFYVPTRFEESGAVVERRLVEMVSAVRREVRLPLAVKLSPFYTAIAHLAAQLDEAGANALVLFNRFYEPDIDIVRLEHAPHLHLSHSPELLLRLRWLALLYGKLAAHLAVTGGVHTVEDSVKSIMAGAQAVQLVSTLLRHGPGRVRALEHLLRSWMEEHEYVSLTQMRGNMSVLRCPDPAALERGNYIHMLQTWGG